MSAGVTVIAVTRRFHDSNPPTLQGSLARGL
jgi:hypothetical protein